MEDLWRVPLPDYVLTPIEVYVNGVRQEPGRDYEQHARELRFHRPLEREGKLGMVRWASIFLGAAGTYRKNDSVDVVYELNGRRTVATGLEVIPP